MKGVGGVGGGVTEGLRGYSSECPAVWEREGIKQRRRGRVG